jgi:hypothetical protein
VQRFIARPSQPGYAIGGLLPGAHVPSWDSFHAVAVLDHLVPRVDEVINSRVLVDGDEPIGMFAFDGETMLHFGGDRGRLVAGALDKAIARGAPRQLSLPLWARLRRADLVGWSAYLQSVGFVPDLVAAAAERARQVQRLGLGAIVAGAR